MSEERLLYSRRWFAWRPVKLVSERWAWLRTVRAERWGRRCGDYFFEWNRYALLP